MSMVGKLESLNLTHLKYFLDSVELGSLTRAAAANHISRPAISAAIIRLEDWASKELITHERRNFALTEEGVKFYRHMRTCFDSFKKQVRANNLDSRRLKIGCSASLVEPFLLPALKRLSQYSSPEIMTGTSAKLLFQLGQDEINLAIVIDDPRRDKFSVAEVMEGEFVVASPSGKMTDLLITTEARPEVHVLTKAISRESKPQSFQRLTVESWGLGVKFALALKGSCLIPDCLLQSGLRKVAIPKFREKYKVCVVYKREEHLSLSEIELVRDLSNKYSVRT